MTRPLKPPPVTCVRSTPSSRANRRTEGPAWAREKPGSLIGGRPGRPATAWAGPAPLPECAADWPAPAGVWPAPAEPWPSAAGAWTDAAEPWPDPSGVEAEAACPPVPDPAADTLDDGPTAAPAWPAAVAGRPPAAVRAPAGPATPPAWAAAVPACEEADVAACEGPGGAAHVVVPARSACAAPAVGRDALPAAAALPPVKSAPAEPLLPGVAPAAAVPVALPPELASPADPSAALIRQPRVPPVLRRRVGRLTACPVSIFQFGP